MDIKEFAERYAVRTKSDACGDTIVPGKQFCKDMPKRVEYRSHVYDGFADARLGICLMFASSRKWNSACAALEAAGCERKQNSGMEGCFKFDPANEEQARLALKLAGIKTRRKSVAPSEAQLAARTAFVERRGNALGSVGPRPNGAPTGGFIDDLGAVGLRDVAGV